MIKKIVLKRIKACQCE